MSKPIDLSFLPSKDLSDALIAAINAHVPERTGRDKLVAAWESEAPFAAALVGTGITLDEIKSGREALCAEAEELERRARIARSIVEAVAAEPVPLKLRLSTMVVQMSPEQYEAEREAARPIREMIQSELKRRLK